MLPPAEVHPGAVTTDSIPVMVTTVESAPANSRLQTILQTLVIVLATVVVFLVVFTVVKAIAGSRGPMVMDPDMDDTPTDELDDGEQGLSKVDPGPGDPGRSGDHSIDGHGNTALRADDAPDPTDRRSDPGDQQTTGDGDGVGTDIGDDTGTGTDAGRAPGGTAGAQTADRGAGDPVPSDPAAPDPGPIEGLSNPTGIAGPPGSLPFGSRASATETVTSVPPRRTTTLPPAPRSSILSTTQHSIVNPPTTPVPSTSIASATTTITIRATTTVRASTTITTGSTTAPTVTTTSPTPESSLIASPTDGATVDGDATITVTANPVPGATDYCWRIVGLDNRPLDRCGSSPSIELKGTRRNRSEAVITIDAVARDASGTSLRSERIAITLVSTDRNPPPPPRSRSSASGQRD